MAAYLYQRQRQLAQYVEVGHGPGRGDVVLLPVSGGVFLGSGVDAIHPCQSQLAAHLLQKVDALAQTVQQRQIKVRLQDAQHHAGEAGAGAHIDDPLAPQVRHS